MLNLDSITLPRLKNIITKYKKENAIKLTGLNKNDLIKLINKLDIKLDKLTLRKINNIIANKESKSPIKKILTEEEKQEKQKKLAKQQKIYDLRMAEHIKKESEKKGGDVLSLTDILSNIQNNRIKKEILKKKKEIKEEIKQPKKKAKKDKNK